MSAVAVFVDLALVALFSYAAGLGRGEAIGREKERKSRTERTTP